MSKNATRKEKTLRQNIIFYNRCYCHSLHQSTGGCG